MTEGARASESPSSLGHLRGRSAFAAAVAFAFLAAPSSGAARCGPGDLVALGESVRAELECRRGRLLGEGACAAPAPPACGRDAAAAAVELIFPSATASASGWSSAALRCQSAIAHAAGRFASQRFRERERGERRTRAARAFARIDLSCAGVTVEGRLSGARLPGAGGACAAAAGRVRTSLATEPLRRCLRASLERIVDDTAPEPLRPSIVLILTDDQRWDTLGFMPATLRRLGGEGLTFTNAFATTPVCSPSRASIFSGLVAHRHGVHANGQEPAFDPRTSVAVPLAAAGYANGFFGKYLNDAEKLGLAPPPGWDEWHVLLGPAGGSFFGSSLDENGALRTLPQDAYSTDVLAQRAVSFIREHADEPFFAVFAPFAPHAPADPAPRHAGSLAGLPPYRPPSWHEPDVSDKPLWVQLLARVLKPEAAVMRDTLRLRELESLAAVDEAVGAITDVLERAGIADSTLVVFTSDHGIHWGEHWSRTKFSFYEESIRVPYLIRHPMRAPTPGKRSELVLNVDLAPTLAAAAGVALAAKPDGESLLPLFVASPPSWRKDFLLETPGELIGPPGRAVRTRRWKYVRLYPQAGIDEELYDLAADPFELENLARSPSHEMTRSRLAARLAKLVRDASARTSAGSGSASADVLLGDDAEADAAAQLGDGRRDLVDLEVEPRAARKPGA